jgi:hypothetical protein
MGLEENLLLKLKSLGLTHVTKMFGWKCLMIHRHFFGGYKVLDESVIVLFLILSPEGYEEALQSGDFGKFQFGNRWVETEINSVEDTAKIWVFIENAFKYTDVRKAQK